MTSHPVRADSAGAASVLLMFGAVLLLGCGDGIPDFTPEELAEATSQVREAFRLQDYEYGADLGARWAEWAPDALELKAWTVANLALARSGGLAKKMADEMSAAHPDSAWSSFASAAARVWTYDSDEEEATLEASEKAVEGLPDLMEATILRADALSMFQGTDSARVYVEALPEELRHHADIQVWSADASFPWGPEPSDSAVEAVLSRFEEVLEEDPNHIGANVSAAQFLDVFDNEPAVALACLQRAADRTPSPSVHARLWSAIFADVTLSDAEKKARVSADIREIVVNGGESPARWAGLARRLEGLDMTDLKVELEDRVLEDYPGSRAAEVVLGNRYQSLRRELWGAPPADEASAVEKRDRLGERLTDFIERRRHFDPELLLDAHWTRFLLGAEDPKTDPMILAEMASGLQTQLEGEPGQDPASYYAMAAKALAEFPETLDDARRLIELGRVALEAEEVGDVGSGGGEAPPEDPATTSAEAEADTDDEEEEPAPPLERAQRAMFSAVTGLMLIQEGQLDKAEEELALARDLDDEDYYARPVLAFSNFYSGRLMERRADLARAAGAEQEAEAFLSSADQFYVQGVKGEYRPNPSMGIPWINPNEVALEALYRKRNGSLDGFEEYLLDATDDGWEERRAAVLAGRIDDPLPMVPFALETLDGVEVTSESLLGRVVVINFWGTW